MELIVTEKANAARRIAEILSGGDATTERHDGVEVYRWGTTKCVGLSGHVVTVDFPPEYEDWRDVRPAELVDAEVQKEVTRADLVDTLQALARAADEVTIATDYDREGELIGKEAYELVTEVADVPVRRVRFSSLTEGEVREAFENPDELDFDLAAAGEARQIIDLLWGAALTRFLSLSSGQLGDDFISVGRVQSPTLKLIVDREREIRAFDPEDYWELFADLATGPTGDTGDTGDTGPTGHTDDGDATESEEFEAQYFYLGEDDTEQERVWDETEAESVDERLRAAETATVTSVRRRTRTDDPPAPFNTTQFIRAAGSLGYGAQRAMSVAEDLYTSGYITYPRTDNTVYPDDLEASALLERFTEHAGFESDAARVLEQDDIEPTRGDTESTDHPPIHPTGEFPARADLSDAEWELYELVVRRFFATCARPAKWAHLRVVAEADGLQLKANGKRLLEPGYHAVYPYFSTTENYVPAVEEGEELAVREVRLEAKQTQPPRRRGQSRLVERMEEMGIGTKATRHHTIEKLYDRGYIEDDPPRPTNLAMAVVDAAEQFADLIVDEGMTQQLEADMAAIAEGETDLEDVTEESREMLERIFEELHESREEIAEHLRESMKADRALGPCPECGERLLVRRSRQGSYFVGCDGFPDCRYTLPLPDKGEPTVIEEECEDHGLRHVRILAGSKTFTYGCPLCQEERAEDSEERVIGECPECGAEHGGELAIKRTRTGSRLVGCTRYPDCEYSLPLPRRGDIEVTEELCEDHDLPELVVHGSGDDPWELGCPICNYAEYRERQRADDLQDLDGIGERTVEKLAEAGVENLDDLRGADADDLAGRVQGVSADAVREWQEAAGAAEA